MTSIEKLGEFLRGGVLRPAPFDFADKAGGRSQAAYPGGIPP